MQKCPCYFRTVFVFSHVHVKLMIDIDSLPSENNPASDFLSLVEKFCSTYLIFQNSNLTNFGRKIWFREIFFAISFHFL